MATITNPNIAAANARFMEGKKRREELADAYKNVQAPANPMLKNASSPGTTPQQQPYADYSFAQRVQNGQNLSSQWATADPNTRDQLHSAVTNLYSGMGAAYDNKSGVWSWTAPDGKTYALNGQNGVDPSVLAQYDRTPQPAPSYSAGPAPAQTPAPAQQQATQAPAGPTNSQIYNNMIMQLLNPDLSGVRDQSNTQAHTQYLEQKAQLETLLKNLEDQRAAGQQGIDNSVASARRALEDSTFQDYMATQQDMSNRGFAANDGLTQDANTRVALRQGDQMAGIQENAAQNRFALDTQINPQLEDTYRKMSGLSESQLAEQLYSQNSSKTMDRNMQLAGIYGDLMKTMLPYDQMTKSDQANLQLDWSKLMGVDPNGNPTLDRDRLNQELQIAKAQQALDAAKLYGYDQNGSATLDLRQMMQNKSAADQDRVLKMIDIMGYDQNGNQTLAGRNSTNDQALKLIDLMGYDSKGNPTRQTRADEQDLALKLMQTMGYDAQGNLTLQGRQLQETIRNNTVNGQIDWTRVQEQIRHNQASEQFDAKKLSADMADWSAKNKLAQSRIDFDYASLTEKRSYDNAMIDKYKDAATDSATRTRLNGLQYQLSAASKVIENKTKRLAAGKTLGQDDPDVQKYYEILNAINSTIDGGGSSSSSQGGNVGWATDPNP